MGWWEMSLDQRRKNGPKPPATVPLPLPRFAAPALPPCARSLHVSDDEVSSAASASDSELGVELMGDATAEGTVGIHCMSDEE